MILRVLNILIYFNGGMADLLLKNDNKLLNNGAKHNMFGF